MTSSTGKTILTMSMSRRGARIAAGVCALGLALVLGGCNDTMKSENANLTRENAELREKSSSLENQQAAMQAQIAQMQQSQAPAGGGSGMNETGSPSRRASNGGGGGGGERVIDVIAGDLLFLPGQASVRAESKKELDKVARDIQSKHAGRTIRVKGYTDTDPIKKAKYPSNEALSLARAESVASYLISKGVSRSTVETVGMGSASPRKTKKESRRVEIVVVE